MRGFNTQDLRLNFDFFKKIKNIPCDSYNYFCNLNNCKYHHAYIDHGWQFKGLIFIQLILSRISQDKNTIRVVPYSSYIREYFMEIGASGSGTKIPCCI